MREFTLFFVLQFISYLNLTIDIRAVAHEQYLVVTATNTLAPLIAWVMVKQVLKAKGWLGAVAVMCGGVTSTWLGMWLTRAWG